MSAAPEVDTAPRPSLKSAVVWSYAMTFGRMAVTTVVTFVLAAMLGPRAYGVLTLALVVILVAQSLLQQVLLTTIIQREDLRDDHLDAGFWMVMLASLVVAGAAAALSPLWAAYNRLPELTEVCLVLSPLILLQGLSVVPEAIMRRGLRFRSLALRSLAAVAAGGVVGIVFAVLDAGVWALVAQQLVTAVAGAAVLWVVVDWRPRLRLPWQAVRDLAGFSTHSAVGGLGVMFALRADVLVIGAFLNPVAVGLYRLAARLPDMMSDISVRSLQQVSLPDLSRLQRDTEALAQRLAKLVHAGAILGLPGLGILAACAGPLLALLGPDWEPAEGPMRLMCLCAAVDVLGMMLGPALQAVGRPGVLSIIAWGEAAFGIAAFALMGTVLRDSGTGEQVVAIALTKLAVGGTIMVITAVVTLRGILHVPVWRVLAPAGPALLAGLAAFGVVAGLDRWLSPGGPAILLLIAYGVLAVVVAGGVLITTDARAAAMWRRQVRALRARISPPPATPIVRTTEEQET